jgi:pyruvate kinase
VASVRFVWTRPISRHALASGSFAANIQLGESAIQTLSEPPIPAPTVAAEGQYRHTKIIATVGPATESAERLSALIAAGTDVVRLNMAHGSGDWVTSLVKRIREVSQIAKRHVAVMMDVKGPEIRTGVVAEPLELAAGEIFEFYTKPSTSAATMVTSARSSPSEEDNEQSDETDTTPSATSNGVTNGAAHVPKTNGSHSAPLRGIDVNYPGLANDVKIGSTVLVDSGLIRMEVLEKSETCIRCRVITPGKLGSRRHINLPGVDVDLPSLTEKDERDIRVGVAAGVDFFALSFVRCAEDILVLRALLTHLGSKARIIAKIEDQGGMRNLPSIVKTADAIMVARGDLGIEVDYHTLALVQTRIVDLCLTEGKPVIIATHLLESMISAPMPTRAEISDISTAVRERADAVMLSGETTIGLYPLECVEVMKNIIRTIEPTEKRGINEVLELKEPKAKMLRSAAVLAQELDSEGNSGIVVFTRSGMLAYTLAALRAVGVPIYAFTDDESVFRQLLLPWGVEPFLMPFSPDPETTIQDSLAYLKRRNWCKKGTWLVVITNVLAHDKIVDTIQVRQVE